MKRIGFASVIVLAALLPLAANAEEPTVIGSTASIKWVAAPPAAGLPAGTQVSVLFGDPSKADQYANRVKFPAGAKIAPHTHPNDENVTVLSGTLKVGLGDKFDAAKMQTIGAGGFVRLPKGTPHYAVATQTTIIQSNNLGPTGRTYTNPADDPTKK
jgi:quercetin dioxygenase-like cupin family protein